MHVCVSVTVCVTWCESVTVCMHVCVSVTVCVIWCESVTVCMHVWRFAQILNSMIDFVRFLVVPVLPVVKIQSVSKFVCDVKNYFFCLTPEEENLKI